MLKDIDWALIELLEQFEPFGKENFKPRFLIRDLKVMSCDTVGQDNKHLRLMVSENGLQRKVICFGFGDFCDKISPEDLIDIVCEVSINEWNGSKEIQLSLVDFKTTK